MTKPMDQREAVYAAQKAAREKIKELAEMPNPFVPKGFVSPSGDVVTGPRPLRKQVPEQTISDECKYCAEGEPEWSPYAKCWIHRRPTLDKRCTRKILGPCGE